MLDGDGDASAMADNRYLLPTVIGGTVVLAWGVVHHHAQASTKSRSDLRSAISTRMRVSR